MRVVRRHGCGLSVWWVDRCELLLKDDIVFKRLKRLSSTRIHQRSQQQTTFEVDMAMTREWEICFRRTNSFFGDVTTFSASQSLSADGPFALLIGISVRCWLVSAGSFLSVSCQSLTNSLTPFRPSSLDLGCQNVTTRRATADMQFHNHIHTLGHHHSNLNQHHRRFKGSSIIYPNTHPSSDYLPRPSRFELWGVCEVALVIIITTSSTHNGHC